MSRHETRHRSSMRLAHPRHATEPFCFGYAGRQGHTAKTKEGRWGKAEEEALMWCVATSWLVSLGSAGCSLRYHTCL